MAVAARTSNIFGSFCSTCFHTLSHWVITILWGRHYFYLVFTDEKKKHWSLARLGNLPKVIVTVEARAKEFYILEARLKCSCLLLLLLHYYSSTLTHQLFPPLLKLKSFTYSTFSSSLSRFPFSKKFIIIPPVFSLSIFLLNNSINTLVLLTVYLSKLKDSSSIPF